METDAQGHKAAAISKKGEIRSEAAPLLWLCSPFHIHISQCSLYSSAKCSLLYDTRLYLRFKSLVDEPAKTRAALGLERHPDAGCHGPPDRESEGQSTKGHLFFDRCSTASGQPQFFCFDLKKSRRNLDSCSVS